MTLSLSVLHNRDFRLLLLTRIFGMMALQAMDVIVGWQVYSLTHDTLILGLTGLTEAVPAIACAFFAGHIVDISRPHRILILSMGAHLLNTFGLLLVAGGLVASPGGILPWLFVSIFISGVARSFIAPSVFSLLPQVVARAQIPATAGWLSGGFQLGAVAGPAIAGLIYGGYGARVAWLLPVSLMVIAFVTLAAIGHPHRHYRGARKSEPTMQSIHSGWRFIWRNQVLLSVMALDMFAVLFGGAVAMLPAVADQLLHVGSEGLGALRAAPAIGAIVTALILAVRPMRHIHATTLLLVIAGFGLCIIGFGLSPWFWLSLLLLCASGAFDSVSMVIRSTLMQLLTPDEMRGRVSAVGSMFIISSNEIGAFESGVAAKLLGLMPSIVLGGVGTLVVVVLTAWLSPKLRRTVVDAAAPAGA